MTQHRTVGNHIFHFAPTTSHESGGFSVYAVRTPLYTRYDWVLCDLTFTIYYVVSKFLHVRRFMSYDVTAAIRSNDTDLHEYARSSRRCIDTSSLRTAG